MTPEVIFRLLHHPDGRTWSVRTRGTPNDGARVVVRFVIDGEPGERARKLRTFAEAQAAAAELIAEQLADGFEPVIAEEQLCEQLVCNWRDDDPSFDLAPLVAAANAIEPRERVKVLAAIAELADHYERDGDAHVLVMLDPRHDVASALLAAALPAATPLLLLALRHADYSVQMRIDSLLAAELARAPDTAPAMLPALMSAIEHPADNLSTHVGGRGAYSPSSAMHAIGRLPDPIIDRLIALLDHGDFRLVGDAAVQLVARASDDRIYAALWQRRYNSHHIAIPLLRVVPLRRDPELRAFLQEFADDPHRRWPRLDYEREQMAVGIADCQADGSW